jgi:peptidoglycan hydrolase-like protein with peptidoglycan-binding domain
MATPNAPLSVGAYGPSVGYLHSLLRQHGFSLPGSEVDRGFFGPITRQTVQEFQKKVGLPVTGEVDERTNSALGTVASECVKHGIVAEPSTQRSIRQQGNYPSATPQGGRFPEILAMLFCILAGIAFGSLRRRKGS